jgi:hypothetical protein
VQDGRDLTAFDNPGVMSLASGEPGPGWSVPLPRTRSDFRLCANQIYAQSVRVGDCKTSGSTSGW